MELVAPRLTELRNQNTHRLIPSRYPTVGILDQIGSPDEMEALFNLESWSNDRINHEFGTIYRLPQNEWATGPGATVVMAAFCHPRMQGGRFNSDNRGAWYAGFTLETAQAEIIYHKNLELAEIDRFQTRLEMREYQAIFHAAFHDLRGSGYEILHAPDSYQESQRFAQDLLETGSNGVVFRSVRDPGGTCLACFRPKLVGRPVQGRHFAFIWEGGSVPRIEKIELSSG